MVFALVAAVLVVVAAYQLTNRAPGDPIHEAVSDGDTAPAPELDLPVLTAGDLGGAPRRLWRTVRDGRLRLSELRGSPVVLSFSSARCDPCRDDGRMFERFAGEAGHAVVVLGVSTSDSLADGRRFGHEQELSFQQVWNPEQNGARRWAVTSVPETFFVSPHGRVVRHAVGAATTGQLERGIEAATAGIPSGLDIGGRRQPLP